VRLQRPLSWLALGISLLTIPGKLSVYVDESGRAWLTDGSKPPTAGARRLQPDEVSIAWNGKWLGPPLDVPSDASTQEDRYLRELRAARQDLELGQVRSAVRRLRRLVRQHPAAPEAPWLLAQVERSRGRLESARSALAGMLSVLAPLDDDWRGAAERMLVELDDELVLTRTGAREARPRLTAQSANFLLHYDHEFAGRDFGERVTDLLEDSRLHVRDSLGRALGRPLDVFVYTRGHYLDVHQHRFGFATVGFYDGAIHAVSSRQPEADLRALVVHEYTHAVFKETVGTHRPFFLNEGIADRAEERLRGRERLSREEWWRLVDALRAGTWLPLVRLVPGFGGLQGQRALLAYLESRAAVELLEERSEGVVARWLARCARGEGWEVALVAESGWNVLQLDAALREEVRSRFPRNPLLESAGTY
jgi:hypothetical protein